jgi:hypothetical protein
MDSLGILLTKSNVNAMGKSVLVYEETSGLMTGALAERMAGVLSAEDVLSFVVM